MITKIDPQTVAPYLRDASNFSGGQARAVVIPESPAELQDFLKSNREPITIAGAGTGLTASRIPASGIVVSLEKFNAVGELRDGAIEVGPAVALASLQERLLGTGFFYPPNPTETWASIGGTAATNASGSRSYKFGVTRDYILEAELALADGRMTRLDRSMKITAPLVLRDGSRLHFPKVDYASPRCKNAAGYYVRPGMDWLDLFIGSDGTLGIFTSIRLQLKPQPADFISGVLFFDQEEHCWRLVEALKKRDHHSLSPCSLEYFDRRSLSRLRNKFAAVPLRAHAALFFEQDVGEKSDYDPLLEQWHDFLSLADVMLDDSWFAQTDKEVREFHAFRHELPQIINEENSRLGRVKMGTDMAVGDPHFLDMMRFYRDTLEGCGLDYVVFGHIGDNHLHINLLPDPARTDTAQGVYQALVRQVLEWSGTVSAEHGIGKLKKNYFRQMVGDKALGELKTLKRMLDPDWILGVGNLFDA
jgi:D-lactate dehydrogenase (cytochrome)